MHRIAFATRSAQIALADMEDSMVKQSLQTITMESPVFVTGLPRAGTTLLLELLESGGEFCSHTYQDMPFILTPVLWSKVAARFRKESELKERAHGDGMLVSVESPEALEEVIWAAYWKKQYQNETVSLWDRRLNYPDFVHFFQQHMKKIALLRGANKSRQLRYLSKNNMNIARLEYLAKIFPQAKIVIPFRAPVQQSYSLLKQHENFLAMHKQDAFAREYMRAIGHYDFGDNLKPIDFSGWSKQTSIAQATEIEFWLRYWVAAYQYLLEHLPENAVLFSFDTFCEQPQFSMQALANFIAVKEFSPLLAGLDRVAPPSVHSDPVDSVSSELLSQANELFATLKAKAVNSL